jgi:DNA processing protein
MTPTEDLSSWIALSVVPGLGDQSLRKLLKHFGPPDQILAASESALSQIVGNKLAERIQSHDSAEIVSKTLAWLEQPGHSMVTLADSNYPSILLQTTDPPPLLYVKGNIDLLSKPAIAVVGSRNATVQGVNNAESFARSLSDCGLCIVSGMALGIDAAAHAGGLAGAGKSVAVVGTGLDRVYPARNKELAHQLAQHGAMISEFPLGTPALANNFPRRNRIISGLSLGCLVVEAAVSSGSLITARLALEQGREVFAIPGSIHSALAKGCHQLIKQGAKLVERADDILEEIQWTNRTGPSPGTATADGNDDPLLQHLGFDPEPIDALVGRTGLSPEQISAKLLELELAGLVQSLPGGRYQRPLK